jgi:tRNA (adenine57-N1/adenine58-N1)-methyltransferase catalytic subunit
MAKIIIQKERKETIDDKEITLIKPRTYYVEDLSQDYHTSHGSIAKQDLTPGKKTTNTNKEVIVFPAQFMDKYKRLKKRPQTISLKDLGVIIAETGLGKESIVIEAGAGSAGSAILFSRICKQVITYDINDKHLAIARENINMLEAKNITLKKGSIYETIEETNADLILLDVPQAEKALETATKAVKLGGFIVAYTIQATQLQAFVNKAKEKEELFVGKSIELMQRKWKVDGNIVRPNSQGIGHSAFLTFVRRIL